MRDRDDEVADAIDDRRTPQGLLKLLRRSWFGMIERGASVTLAGSVVGSNLEIVATWGNGQTYQKAYVVDPEKRACDYARDFLRSLLGARGAL